MTSQPLISWTAIVPAIARCRQILTSKVASMRTPSTLQRSQTLLKQSKQRRLFLEKSSKLSARLHNLSRFKWLQRKEGVTVNPRYKKIPLIWRNRQVWSHPLRTRQVSRTVLNHPHLLMRRRKQRIKRRKQRQLWHYLTKPNLLTCAPRTNQKLAIWLRSWLVRPSWGKRAKQGSILRKVTLSRDCSSCRLRREATSKSATECKKNWSKAWDFSKMFKGLSLR